MRVHAGSENTADDANNINTSKAVRIADV